MVAVVSVQLEDKKASGRLATPVKGTQRDSRINTANPSAHHDSSFCETPAAETLTTALICGRKAVPCAPHVVELPTPLKSKVWNCGRAVMIQSDCSVLGATQWPS